MTDVVLYEYEIIGKNSLFHQDGKDLREGEKIKLSLMQAREFPGQLKALTPEGDVTPKEKVSNVLDGQNYQLMRDHEKEQLLTQRQTELETELDRVEKELAEVQGRIKANAPKKTGDAPAPSSAGEKKKG